MSHILTSNIEARLCVVAETHGARQQHGRHFSSDGVRTLGRRDHPGRLRLLRRNLQSGEEKELDGPGFWPGTLALSRDGSRLAWIIAPDENTRIMKVMPFPDDTPKETQRLKNADAYTIAWSPDGRFIYYSDVKPGGGKDCHLWRVRAAGGNPQDLGSAAGIHEHLSVHPDGTRVTFWWATINPEPAQLWVTEDFLPAAKGAAGAPPKK